MAAAEGEQTSNERKPTKRARTAEAVQSSQIDALFANPERTLEVNIGPKAKTLAPPPEIVTNVQGSSAGAGSGEFHVYKASRRREYERLRAMDEEVEQEEADRKWAEQREEAKRKGDAKLSKNRARREKLKARLAKKEKGGDADGMETTPVSKETANVKKKLVPAPLQQTKDANGGEDQSNVGKVAEEDGIVFLEDG